VTTSDNHHLILSSENHIAELLAAPQEQLSFHAVVTDVSIFLKTGQECWLIEFIVQLFRPKYTMGGMELSDDPKKNESNVHSRALRVLLPSFYPVLQDKLKKRISETLAGEMMLGSVRGEG
jgi:hypothetical protein